DRADDRPVRAAVILDGKAERVGPGEAGGRDVGERAVGVDRERAAVSGRAGRGDDVERSRAVDILRVGLGEDVLAVGDGRDAGDGGPGDVQLRVADGGVGDRAGGQGRRVVDGRHVNGTGDRGAEVICGGAVVDLPDDRPRQATRVVAVVEVGHAPQRR